MRNNTRRQNTRNSRSGFTNSSSSAQLLPFRQTIRASTTPVVGAGTYPITFSTLFPDLVGRMVILKGFNVRFAPIQTSSGGVIYAQLLMTDQTTGQNFPVTPPTLLSLTKETILRARHPNVGFVSSGAILNACAIIFTSNNGTTLVSMEIEPIALVARDTLA
jgi:hypothetical protein